MRQVRLSRPAFINASYCDIGAVVTIADGVALAPFMKLIEAVTAAPSAPAVPVPPQNHAVTVRYDEIGRKIAITIDGVETTLDHADLKLRMD
jgi:hypothetical protein